MPTWFAELYRIGALRGFLAEIRTALMVATGMLIVTVVVDFWPARFLAALIGVYFTSSALGMLASLMGKMDRESGDAGG